LALLWRQTRQGAALAAARAFFGPPLGADGVGVAGVAAGRGRQLISSWRLAGVGNISTVRLAALGWRLTIRADITISS
jgi:hypothetical protein